jgi:hypothetical protein
LILTSCSSGFLRKDSEGNPYQSSGVEQYFLPQLPKWANSSASGRCFKKHNIHYLDFKKLSEVYELSYPELIEFQAQYNEKLESYFSSAEENFLKPVEEANLFSNVLESVKGGVKSFKLPAVQRVEVIWLDRYIDLNQVGELKKMSISGRFDENLPILFSSCLSREDLNQWIIDQELEDIGFYTLSAEWLSPYGSDLKLRPGPQIELRKLMGDKTQLRFIAPKEVNLPSEIIF